SRSTGAPLPGRQEVVVNGYRRTCWLVVLVCAGCSMELPPDKHSEEPPGPRSPEVAAAFLAIDGPAFPHHHYNQVLSPSRFIEGLTPVTPPTPRGQLPDPPKVEFPRLSDWCEDCPEAIDLLSTTRERVEHDLLPIVAADPRIHVRYRAALIL